MQRAEQRAAEKCGDSEMRQPSQPVTVSGCSTSLAMQGMQIKASDQQKQRCVVMAVGADVEWKRLAPQRSQ